MEPHVPRLQDLNNPAELENNKNKNSLMSLTYLLGSAEDVSVILAEPPNSGQPPESARELVTMQRPEVGPADGKLFPGAKALFEHETGHETRK